MKIRAVIAATLLCSSFAFSQLGPGHGAGRGMERGFGAGFHSGKVVAGAPYSATISNTSVKTLIDGNTIQRVTSGSVARDSQGRTYATETVTGMFGQTGAKTMTFITDPVAGYVFTLNSETMTATRRALHTRSEAVTTESSAAKPIDPNVVSVDKGIQLINGVNAQGKVTTRTIPAGTMGNEKPIVSTFETWYSPELKVVVYSKRTDLREGNSTYALTNIKTSEPDASLFQVPAGYTVKDAARFGGGAR